MRSIFNNRNQIIFLLALCLAATGCRDRNPTSPTENEIRPSTPNSVAAKTSTTSGTPEAAERPEIVSRPELSSTRHSISPPTEADPRTLLKKTVDVYRSADSYSDHGTVRIVGKMTDPDAEPIPWLCTVAFQFPGQLRLEINDGKLVSDGEDCFALIRTLPDQVLHFKPPTAPKNWTLDVLCEDPYLDQSMELGLPETILRFPPQLVLLFAQDPLKTLAPEDATVEFVEPQWLDETPCDRIRVADAAGVRILWIGRTNRALLRFDYIVEGLPVPQGVESIRIIRIEMADAEFNREIAPEAFQMHQPQNARQVPAFQSVASQLLGRPVKSPETLFLKEVENSGSDKNGPTSFSIADASDKVLVLCFWTTWSEPCRAALTELTQIRNSMPDDSRIRFLAVNLDEDLDDVKDDEKTGSEIRKTLSDWKVSTPPWLDSEGKLAQSLHIDSFPTVAVLGPKGIVEFYFRGIVPATTLGDVVREILAGEKPHEKGKAFFVQQREEHRKILRSMVESDFFAERSKSTEPISEQNVAPPKKPDRFSLKELWKVDTLLAPGNITLFPSSADNPSEPSEPRLLIPCDGNSLAVLDLSGKVLQKMTPKGFANDELLTSIRTGADKTGRRYIGVASLGGRTIRVFDAEMKPILSYPLPTNAPNQPIQPNTPSQSDSTNSVENSPSSSKNSKNVADFRFVDIYENGTQSLLIGLIALDTTESDGDLLCAVDLQGKEIWRDDSTASPFLVDSYVSNGKRGILSLGQIERRGKILKYDLQGKRLGTLEIGKNFNILWFDVAETEDKGNSEVCVILFDSEEKKYFFAALDWEGRIRWRHPLPTGMHRKPIEQIVTGPFLASGVPQWLVPTPDGTILLFDRDGKLFDSFSFGTILSGIAVVSDGKRRLLIVADADSVTAWEIAGQAPPLTNH